MAMPSVEPAPQGPLDLLSGVVRGWDRFWFRATDPTPLGLIRLCVGLVVLYVHLVYTFDLPKLIGPHAWLDTTTINEMRNDMPVVILPSGWKQEQPAVPPQTQDEAKKLADERYQKLWNVDPRNLQARGIPMFSIWFHVQDPTWILVIHGLGLVAIFLFAIGFATRITSVLTWVMALSYVQRAPTTLFGMDAMMMIALFYLMIGPSGAALSVDRLLARWWQLRQARRQGLPAPPWLPPAPSVLANFALRLFQIHFCIIYLASGLSKLQGSAWWNGIALWYTMANYEFNPLNWKLYEDFLVFLTHHRLLWELVTSGGVLYTLTLEIGLPFLIWRKETRWLMILGAVLLHTGISLSMGLTTFGLLMISMLLSFVPPEAVRRLLQSLPVVRNTGAAAPVPVSVAA
jgi:hypothetical protein